MKEKFYPTLGSQLSETEERFWLMEASNGTLEATLAQNPTAAERVQNDPAWARISNTSNCPDENYGRRKFGQS